MAEQDARTPRDERRRAAVERVRTVSRLLDTSIRVPGTQRRIGLDPLLGIVPVGGDLLAATGAVYILFEGVRLGLPRATVLKMAALVAVDLVVGSVPLLGPVFDAVWTANAWNARTIERHVEAAGR